MASRGPSLPGAFDVLEAARGDRLVSLKHKLRDRQPSCQSATLLHAMVLLVLGQDAEGRTALESLKGDAVAQLVARKWAGVAGEEPPEEPPDVSWAVARLYHLLAEEGLCLAASRDAAYRQALGELAARGDPRLAQLQEEAQNRCGPALERDPEGFQTLHSHLGCLPPNSPLPSGTRSQPRPINTSDWSHAHSLRSTGSPASVASDLEISQSPTLPFLSPHRGAHGPSKLCHPSVTDPEPPPAPTGGQEPEEVSWPLSVEPAGSPDLSDTTEVPEVALATGPDSPAAPEPGSHYPVECTEVPEERDEDVQPTVSSAEPQVSVGGDPSQRAEGPATLPPQPPKTSPQAPSLSSPSLGGHPPPPASLWVSSLGHSEASEQKFYNFVVLHAMADEVVAMRVRDRLETLGVPDGATFCEDFRVPGRGELRCLQDAIDHAGFTILLLTPSFDCRLSLHQVQQALTHSFTQVGRQDCVIPFLPLECSQDELSPDTTSLLASLVWLDEHSPVFTRKVTNTFKPQRLRAHRARWQREQEARMLREHSQQLEAERQRVAAAHAAHAAYAHSWAAWHSQMDKVAQAFRTSTSLGAQAGSQVPLGVPPPFPTWAGCPQPPWLGGTPTPSSFPQAPPFPQASPFPPASPVQPQTPGPLIIHHAQMVQLGVNNHMLSQGGPPEPEDKTE